MDGKVIIFSAPSGTGKTTIIKQILPKFAELEFSISATCRAPRSGEQDGRDYYFISNDEFDRLVKEGAFIEWEEVYAGTRYGTLRREIERIWAKGHTIVFDIDVKGGVNLKKIFGDQAMSVFIMPPSIDELRRRLEGRATDSPETITRRINKAEEELGYSKHFDKIVVNDVLEDAIRETECYVSEFLNK